MANVFIFLLLCRDGFTFAREIGGLLIFGRGRRTEKGGFIRQMVISFLVILKMDGETGNFYVLMSEDQGLILFIYTVHFYF